LPGPGNAVMVGREGGGTAQPASAANVPRIRGKRTERRVMIVKSLKM
jgi:hypothetical protein